MTLHALSSRQNEKSTLRRRLLACMLLLVLVLTVIAASGLLVFGMLEDPKKSMADTLGLQMDFFDSDMESSWSQLTVMGIDLSEDISASIDQYLNENDISAADIAGDLRYTFQLESELLPVLSERTRRVPCSGGFIMLSQKGNGTQESEMADAAGEATDTVRYPGLYVIRENTSDVEGRLVLFRGLSAVAKANHMNLHGKWRMDYEASSLLGYNQLMDKGWGNLPLEQTYRIIGPVELTGTDEQVFYLCVPLVGEDHTVYGLCGFEVNRRFFREHYQQPTRQPHLICMFSRIDDTATVLNANESFSCGVGYAAPRGVFSAHSIGSGLLQIDGRSKESAGISYIGMQKSVPVSYDDPHYMLTVMIPKEDLDVQVRRYVLLNVVLVGTTLFVAVVCCLYLSRRFLRPILESLKSLREDDFGQGGSNIVELDELTTFLQEKNQAHQQAIQTQEARISELENDKKSAEKEAARLAYSRKTEIDPLLYEHFKSGLKTLTPAERQVLELYLQGLGTREVCEKLGIRESTLRFHNKNIYSKLGVNSRRQAVLYAAVVRKDPDIKKH